MGNDDEVVWCHPDAVVGVAGVDGVVAVVVEEADVNVDGEGDVAARGVVELTGDGDGSIGGTCCCCCWYISSNSAWARSAIEKTEPVDFGGDFVRLPGLGTISIDDNAVFEVVDPAASEDPVVFVAVLAGGGCFATRPCCSFSTGEVGAVDILNPEMLFPSIVTGDDGGILLPGLDLLEPW